MAEYKNWYLAGGSGMKDERKKLKLIILQCIAVITANFITIWYFEELFFRGFWYVIFASFILTFIYIIRSFCCLRKIRVFWFVAIPVFLFGIYLAFLFNDGIKKLNFQVYKEKRTEIVQMVQNNQIKIRKDMELIELPEDYKKCSSGGEVVVRKNNGSYTVGFWYTQGFLDSGFSLFAYSNDDSRTDVIQMVKEYGGIEYEINLSEKEKGWYYVTAKVGE